MFVSRAKNLSLTECLRSPAAGNSPREPLRANPLLPMHLLGDNARRGSRYARVDAATGGS
jgi:hypothetical protein